MPEWKRILYVMFVSQMIAAIGFSTIFPFLPLVIEELGVASGFGGVAFWAGMVFSAQAVTMMIASPIWGSVADRYGRKPMVERAMFGGALVIGLMAFAQNAEQLVLLRAIQGAVTGVVSAANALVAATAPKGRTGYAMGFLQVGLWSGVAIGPLIGGLLADFISFQAAFLVTAALLFVGGVLVRFGFREEFTPPSREERPRMRAAWGHVLRAPGVREVFLVRFVAWLGRNVIVPFAPLYVAVLLANGALVGTVTGLMIAVSSAAGTATAIVLGRVGDRVGHRRVLLGASVLAAIAYAPQAFVTNAWQLVALQALSGAAVGGIMPSLSALLNLYTESGEAGAVYGLDNAIVSASRAVAPLVGSAVVVAAGYTAFGAADPAFGYRLTFGGTALLFVVSAAIVAWRMPDVPVADASPSDG